MEITATLIAYLSKHDINGNSYTAMRFIDHKSGREVCGTVSGGEGNVYSLMLYWSDPNDWDRSIRFESQRLPIREFNRLTKGWKYAGCTGEELAAFVRAGLMK